MGLELARAWVTIRGDASGLSRDFDSVQQQVESRLNDLRLAGAAVMGVFSAFGTGILRQGLASAGTFEQTTIQMETMLGSTEAAKKMMEDLTEFAVKTPFEMPGILQVANGLIMFGERGDEVLDTLNILADASGGTASQFQILGLVLNQIRGVGKLLTQDFRQLSTRGIVSLQDLADHYKVTTAEAQKMLSSGKITFKDFREILKGLTEEGGRFYKMAEKQSQSLTGLISTYQDAKNITIRMIATPLIPYVKGVMDRFIQAADAVSEFVKESGEAVGLAFTGATAFATFGAALFGAGLAAKFLGLSLKTALLGTGVAAVFIAAGAAIGVLIAKLKETEEFMTSIKEIGTNLSAMFAEAWESTGGVIEATKETVQGFFIIVSEWFTKVADWLSLMTTDWKLTWELIKANNQIILTGIMDKVYVTFNSMSAAAVASASAMLQVFKDLWQGIKHVFDVIYHTGVGIFKALVIQVENVFKGLLKAVLDGVSGFLRMFEGQTEGVFGLAKENKMLGDMAAKVESMSQSMTGEKSPQFAFLNEAAKIDSEMPDLAANAANTFMSTFFANLKDSPYAEQVEDLKEYAEQTKKAMELEKERRRAQKERDKVTEEEKKGAVAPDAEDGKGLSMDLGHGRVGFAELGSKMQELLFKQAKDDKVEVTNSLLKDNNKIQNQLLEEAKKDKGSTAKLTAED